MLKIHLLIECCSSYRSKGSQIKIKMTLYAKYCGFKVVNFLYDLSFGLQKLNLPLFIEVLVPSQECECLCVHVLLWFSTVCLSCYDNVVSFLLLIYNPFLHFMQMKKETKSLQDYEQSLLMNYKGYLEVLEKYSTGNIYNIYRYCWLVPVT